MIKKIVLAFGPEKKKIDPNFCPHTNAFTVTEYGETWFECLDCGATIGADTGEIVRVASDEIPY